MTAWNPVEDSQCGYLYNISESIEALKERVPDKMSGTVDVEDADNPAGFELPGADLSDLELDVVVLPAQADEFTCVECFLVKHRSQVA